MRPLDKQTELELAEGCRLEVLGAGKLRVSYRGQQLVCSDDALLLARCFRSKKSVGQAVQELTQSSGGTQRWVEITALIQQLISLGALAVPEGVEVVPSADHFVGTSMHTRMLNDTARTQAFIAAIHKSVRPGDVVIDIGTGSGILAVAAALAGAKRVYAIEASSIADTAQRVFEVNQVQDKITLVRGASTAVDLPERADVIVSELLGDDPLSENLLTVFADARKRWLKDSGCLVPGQLEIGVCGLLLPKEELDRVLPTAHNLQRWKHSYNVDLSPLASLAESQSIVKYYDSRRLETWTSQTPPIVLGTINTATHDGGSLQLQGTFTPSKDTRVNAFRLYFTPGPAPLDSLSTCPGRCTPNNHWTIPTWILPSPITFSQGATYAIVNRRVTASRPGSLEFKGPDISSPQAL